MPGVGGAELVIKVTSLALDYGLVVRGGFAPNADVRVPQYSPGVEVKSVLLLVSVRKVIESYECCVIQVSYRSMEDKTDVDFRKSWLL